MPEPSQRALKASERRALGDLAEKVKRHNSAASEARQAQNQLWMKLLKDGVSKTAIADASQLSHGALNFRLKKDGDG